jgi:putative PEP-CTERM system TPR-repeat lipoprotein
MIFLNTRQVSRFSSIIQSRTLYTSMLFAFAVQVFPHAAKAAFFDEADNRNEHSLLQEAPESSAERATEMMDAVKTLRVLENTYNQDALQFAKQGIEKLQSGDKQQGLKELSEAWSLDRRLIMVGVALGINHLQNREYQEALQLAKEIQTATTQADFGLGYTLEGMVHAAKGELDEAEKAFKTAIKATPTEKNALLNLAMLGVDKKKYSDAKLYLQKVIDIDSTNLKALEQLAKIEVALGNSQNATLLLNKAMNAHPNEIGPVIALSQIYLTLHDYQGVLRLTENNPNPGILEMRGKAYLNLGERDEAKEVFENIIQKLPQSASANYLLAEFFANTGKLEDASQQIESTIKKDPNFLPARIGQVKTLFFNGKSDEAYKAAQVLINEFGDKQEVISIAGWLATKRRDFKAAEKYFEQIAKNKLDTEVVLWWVNSLWAQNKQDDGFKILKNWLKEHPDDIGVQMALADGYMGLQQKSEAKEAYLKIIEKQPKSASAYNNLAWLTQDTDLKQAIHYAESAYDLEKENPQVMDTLGLLLIKDGKLDQGEALLKLAADKAPENGEFLYHFAEALIMRKKHAEAVPIFVKLGKLNLSDAIRERVKVLSAEASKQ